MSERSCENCKNGRCKLPAIKLGACAIPLLVCEHLQDFAWGFADKIAPICTHYEERAELCGVHTTRRGWAYCCLEVKGHEGEHFGINTEGAGGLSWSDPTPTAFE